MKYKSVLFFSFVALFSPLKVHCYLHHDGSLYSHNGSLYSTVTLNARVEAAREAQKMRKLVAAGILCAGSYIAMRREAQNPGNRAVEVGKDIALAAACFPLAKQIVDALRAKN